MRRASTRLTTALMPPPNHTHHQMQNLLLTPANRLLAPPATRRTPFGNITNPAQRILSPIRIQSAANTTTPSVQDENELPIVSVDEDLFDTCEPSKKQTTEAAPVVQELGEDTDILTITVGAQKCTRLCLTHDSNSVDPIPFPIGTTHNRPRRWSRSRIGPLSSRLWRRRLRRCRRRRRRRRWTSISNLTSASSTPASQLRIKEFW